MKRVVDIVSSSIGIFLLSPLFVVVAIILKFSGEGEVLFLQERMGYRNRPFMITKLVTMVKAASQMGSGDYTIQNDPRVLPVGKFLRKTKLNELCQLWDVLRGKMSLVGPRPQMLRIHALYPPSYAFVLDRVRPGITGIGSLVFRDEERLLTDAEDRDYCYKEQIVPYKAELELWYVQNQSLWLDLKIVLWTLWLVIRPQSKAVESILPAALVRPLSSFDGRPLGMPSTSPSSAG